MAGPRNLVLAGLPEGEIARLRPVPVLLQVGQTITEANRPFDAVWLPDSSVLSVLREMADGSAVSAALIGHDGCVCPSAATSDMPGRTSIMCEIAGVAWRIRLDDFEAEVARHGRFSRRVRRSERMFTAQALELAACNAVHPLERRLATVLLLIALKAGRNTFEITHETLAILVGVQRPSVTLALGSFAERGLIRHRRGSLTVADTARLADVACECYDDIARIIARASRFEAG